MNNKNLCLGTVQFGLNYGINNTTGKIKDIQIKNILNYAKSKSIEWLDTAQNYGNAEELIGKSLINKNDFKIINKINSIVKFQYSEKLIERYESNFQDSLKKLCKNKIDLLLIHNYVDLKLKNINLFNNWLLSLKVRNLVNKIGISIYKLSDLKNISLELIEVIQLPISLLDQSNLQLKLIEDLQKKGITFHARSIFLQGLVFQENKNLQNHFSERFRAHHKNFRENFNSDNKKIIGATFSFLKKLDFIETIIVGIDDLENLKEICDIWFNNNNYQDYNYKLFSWENNNDIDPRRWNWY